MRFNYENLTKELGEEKGKEVMNVIENCYGHEGLYEGWSDIRFEVVPEFPDRPKTGFMISKDIMGEEVHEYNPSYVSEDSIYDSELNWDHYIIFYVNIGCDEYVRRYINKEESADMMREEFRKMANESFGMAIAGRIADLLAAETSSVDFEAISNVTKTMSVMPALSHDAPGCWVEAGYSLQQVYANDEFVIVCMLKFGEGEDSYDGDCIFHVFSDCSFEYVGQREQVLTDCAKIFKQYETESEAE